MGGFGKNMLECASYFASVADNEIHKDNMFDNLMSLPVYGRHAPNIHVIMGHMAILGGLDISFSASTSIIEHR